MLFRISIFYLFLSIINAATNQPVTVTYEGCSYCFDDEEFRRVSTPFAGINSLSTLQERVFDGGIVDYSRTHILAMDSFAIIEHQQPREFRYAVTGGIFECVGIVIQKMTAKEIPAQSMVGHISMRWFLEKTDEPQKKCKNDFFGFVSEFLTSTDMSTVKVNLFTTYNTQHMLELYDYLKSIGISPVNMTLNGSFDGNNRPVRLYRDNFHYNTVYLPNKYAAKAIKVNSDHGDYPITDEFWDQYFAPLSLCVDSNGQVHTAIKHYLDNVMRDDESYPKQLCEAFPHIALGLLNCIPGTNRKLGFAMIPSTQEECAAAFTQIKREQAEKTKHVDGVFN